MRSVWFIIATISVTGCRFSWKADVDTGCGEFRTWYRDADGDRWGVAGDSQEECGPEGEYTARNDRDCDDTDANITGRIGSICPEQLVALPNNDPTQFSGVTVGGSEVVIVHGDTPLVWARAAEDACGTIGWGGELLSLSEPAGIIAVLDSLPAGHKVWAGYVGVTFDSSAAYPSGTAVGTAPSVAGQWVFADGTPVPEARLCSFNGSFGADSSDYDPALGFLALIRDRPPEEADGGSSDYCFGTPDQVLSPGVCTGQAHPCYPERLAHFVCSRPSPGPERYAL